MNTHESLAVAAMNGETWQAMSITMCSGAITQSHRISTGKGITQVIKQQQWPGQWLELVR
jgi:hypothetical protein